MELMTSCDYALSNNLTLAAILNRASNNESSMHACSGSSQSAGGPQVNRLIGS